MSQFKLRTFASEREPAQPFADNSPVTDGTPTDMKAMVIANYLEDLGPLKRSLSHSTLVTACQLALEGRGPLDLKD
ncbi:hypothetical protein PENVUL_c026G07314 [Penicillium vulpinum]|uniref:Uncharacterized protein n=1 Tax=Penicillium vulpinum TaxID=29845 RepID=A0A1V6RUG3_9EURO|nr:hypothetical protein PENVUL_c026G07314 [Penicillium vulpinum]